MSLGGKGCISVLSNVAPAESVAICDRFFEGKVKESCELQLKYLPLINALFSEVNPIPVKAAMAAMGFCEDYLRLPLTSMEEAHKKVLLDEMRNLGIKF
jgi:4-hydroxy-tetrahydrodipicolinate synthase